MSLTPLAVHLSDSVRPARPVTPALGLIGSHEVGTSATLHAPGPLLYHRVTFTLAIAPRHSGLIAPKRGEGDGLVDRVDGVWWCMVEVAAAFVVRALLPSASDNSSREHMALSHLASKCSASRRGVRCAGFVAEGVPVG